MARVSSRNVARRLQSRHCVVKVGFGILLALVDDDRFEATWEKQTKKARNPCLLSMAQIDPGLDAATILVGTCIDFNFVA
ncbi:MAG: hypothetical protein ACKO15_04995, partial [Burkholderiales bacterium]